MFGYEDVEAYEDALYHEESSSDAEIDSEVEFQLYSQVHYANNITEMKIDGRRDIAALDLDATSVKDNEEQAERTKKVIVSTDSDVVVISDVLDVIILSDSEGDDSVYAHKNAKHLECYLKQRKDQSIGEPAPGSDTGRKHSTPSVNRLAEMQKMSHWMGRTCPQIQERTLMKESGSSGTESDDDAMENLMVLGQDTEESDNDNIQLNVVGCEALRNKGGNLHSQWFICEKDLQKPFGDCRNRYYAPGNKNLDCRNCGKKGHFSNNCPSPKKFPPCCLCGVRGHLQKRCPERYCTNCSMPGHWFKDCIERAYWKKRCHRCNMTGHYADACPEIWRQYHLTTSHGPIVSGSSKPEEKRFVYCYNCARRGHYGHECLDTWMHKYVYPVSPLVYHYDTEQDIKKREWRIQRKVEELQDAGLLKTSLPAKRWCREPASKDFVSKKTKKKQKRELLKKRYVEQEQSEFTRNSSMTKCKTKPQHHPSHLLKKFIGTEKDFPREFAAKSKATNVAHRRNHQSPLFVHSNPPHTEALLDRMSKKSRNKRRRKKKYMQAPMELAKKKMKKVKNTKVSSPIPSDDLIIKQKKKRKKRSKIKLQESVD